MASTDVVVVGAGPAGLACAASALDAGMSVRVIGGFLIGGQLLNVPAIREHTTIPEGTQGAEYAGQLTDRATGRGAALDVAQVQAVESRGDAWTVHTTEGSVTARYVVLATGTTPDLGAVAGAESLAGRGVCDCAMCDGPLFVGRDVAIIGGERWWASDALLLADIGRSVTVFPGVGPVPPEIASDTRLTVVAQAAQVRVVGEGQVRAVQWTAEGRQREAEVAAVFVAKERRTARSLLEGAGARLDEGGRVLVDAELRAGPNGLFAVGDVRSGSTETLAGAVADGERVGKLLRG